MPGFSRRFSGGLGLALALAALGLGARTAQAQAAPLTYFTPGWPLGFAGGAVDARGASSYGNFPSFDGGDVRNGGLPSMRYNFPNAWFVGSEAGVTSLNGIGQASAFGPSIYSQGVQFGYNFKNSGGLPVTVYAGFDTLKYDNGIAGPFTSFDSASGSLPGYSAHAGVEYRPTSDLSLSLGFGYTQQQSGRVDSNINSNLLPGASSFAIGPR